MGGYYHLSISIITRSKGQSAVACAAYRSGQRLADFRYGRIHDYQDKRGILETGIEVPPGSPTWASDREALWNEVEKRENRRNSQVSREFTMAFDSHLDADDRHQVLKEFLQEQLVSRGIVADWAIHAPSKRGSQLNYHCHVMSTLRRLGPDGFEDKERELNQPQQILQWREAWAQAQNRVLERKDVRDERGDHIRVDHRSYRDQGVDLLPTVHLGPNATQLERSGKRSDLGNLNREIAAANDNRQLLKRRARELTRAELELAELGAPDRQKRPERYRPERRSSHDDQERSIDFEP